MPTATPLTDHWHELVTVSLLGTDRRDPPPAPAGGVADVVADARRDTPSGWMLADVAATVAARRAGLRPAPPEAPLQPPVADGRPIAPPAAARRWRTIVTEWAVLEDEWLLTLTRRGWRPPPDVLVALLRRHRGDAARFARVAAAGGPLVGWLVDHDPDLGRPPGARVPSAETADALGVDGLPGLAVPPELVRLLEAGPRPVVAAVVTGFAERTYAIAHANVLMNFIARCRTDVLVPLAAGLRGLDPALPTGGLAHSLADLAECRRAMLDELEPT
jgi:hypothetical protein